MKKQVQKALIIGGLLYSAISIFNAEPAMTYSPTPPSGYTGSPLDNKTCTSCHSGAAVKKNDIISTDIPDSGYVAGKTYNITIKLATTSSKVGYSLTSETSAKTKAGKLSASLDPNQASRSTFSTSGFYAFSSGSGISPINQEAIWKIQWTAPTSGLDSSTFYVCINESNANSRDDGDRINTSSLLVKKKATSGGSSSINTIKENFQIYPTQLKGGQEINIANEENKVLEITIYDFTGKEVYQAKGHINKIETSTFWNKGIYIMAIKSGSTLVSSKIVIE